MADPQLTFPFGLDDDGNPIPPTMPPGGGVANQYASPPMAAPSEQVSANPYQDAVLAHVNANPTSQQSALVQAVQDQQRAQTPGAQSVTQSSSSSSQGMEVTPEMRAHSAAAYAAKNKEAATYAAQGDMAAQQATETTARAADAAGKLDKFNEETQQRMQQHEADLVRLQKDSAAAAADYAKQAKAMDPERIMHGGKRVTAAIAMAIGAGAASYLKTENFAMKTINDQLDRDWTKQKEQLAGSKDKLTLSQKAIQDSRSAYTDSEAARLNYRAGMKDAIAAHAEELEARHKGGMAQVQGQTLSAKVQAEAEEDRVKRDQIQARTTSKSSSTSVAQAAPTVKTTADLIKEATDRANMKLATDKAYGPKGPTDQDNAYANKVRDRLTALGSVVSEGRKLNESRGKESWISPLDLAGVSEDARTTDMLEARVKDAKVRAQTGAAANKDEIERVGTEMYGGARTNAGKIDAFNKSNNLDIMKLHTDLNQMHPQLKAEAIERIKAAFPPEIAAAIVDGSEVRDWSAGGPGGTVRNKK